MHCEKHWLLLAILYILPTTCKFAHVFDSDVCISALRLISLVPPSVIQVSHSPRGRRVQDAAGFVPILPRAMQCWEYVKFWFQRDGAKIVGTYAFWGNQLQWLDLVIARPQLFLFLPLPLRRKFHESKSHTWKELVFPDTCWPTPCLHLAADVKLVVCTCWLHRHQTQVFIFFL